MKKQVLLVCAMALSTITMNAQNVQWTNVGGDGLWSTATNWDGDALPSETTNAQFKGAVAADCEISSGVDAVTKQLKVGDGGDYGTLTVKDGGTLTCHDGWSAVGWNGSGALVVEDGAFVNFKVHLWMAWNPDAVSNIDLSGHIKVDQNIGFAWHNTNAVNENGSGIITIQDTGYLELAQYNDSTHPDGMFFGMANSSVDIVGNGLMTIVGDKVDAVNEGVANNNFTIDGGDHTDVIVVRYNEWTNLTYVFSLFNDDADAASLSVGDNTALDFSVYPNPASGSITVSSEAAISSVQLFNSLGQQVLSADGASADVSGLATGVYVLKATDANGNEGVQRVIVE